MIINRLCYVLDKDENMLLLPDEIRTRYTQQMESACEKGKNREFVWKRMICDYIAEKTDAEAVRLYNKIASAEETSVFVL